MFSEIIWPIIFWGVLGGLYVILCYHWGARLARITARTASFLVILPYLPGVWIGNLIAGHFERDEDGEHYDGGMR